MQAPAPAAPSIKTPPASVTVTSGQTATFSVSVNGSAPFAYQWQKNGTTIAGAIGSSYTTPPLSTGDSGTKYSVIVGNMIGSVASAQASVTVNPVQSAPTITSRASAAPNPAAVNESVHFSVGASDADGDTLTFSWNFGDGSSGSGSAVAHAYSATGTFNASVSVSDGHGNTASSSVSVQVAAQVAINSGGQAAGAFAADSNFNGGKTYSTTASISTAGVTNPAPQAIYQTERYGNFTYTISGLADGTPYTVRLHFAEIYWNSAGSRLFNVSINQQQVLTNFDIYAAAGGKFKAVVQEFSAQSTNGQIAITYSTIKDNAKSSGIEVVPTPASGSTAAAATGSASAAAPAADTSSTMISSADSSIDSIALGAYAVGTKFSIPLQLPDSGVNAKHPHWAKAAELPKGVRVSNNRVIGKMSTPGTYNFTLGLQTADHIRLVNTYTLTITSKVTQ